MQVKFHPTRQDSLLTAGDDGLVNYVDISQASEEDAIQYTLDTSSTPVCVYLLVCVCAAALLLFIHLMLCYSVCREFGNIMLFYRVISACRLV